jgi:hypothetical protein
MKGISAKEADSKAVKGLAMCWVYRKRSFSLSGNLAKLYADEITLHSKSNKAKFGYEMLEKSGVLLSVTRWRVIGFTESEVVRWSEYQCLSNREMGGIMEEEGFILKTRVQFYMN